MKRWITMVLLGAALAGCGGRDEGASDGDKGRRVSLDSVSSSTRNDGVRDDWPDGRTTKREDRASGNTASAADTSSGASIAGKPADSKTAANNKPSDRSRTGNATSVRIVRAENAAVQPWVYGQGTVRAARREFLTFPSAGRIAYVDPKLKVGDRVKKGQLIAYQQPDRAAAEQANARAGVSNSKTDLDVARAAQREAKANLDLAQETFRRFRILLSKKSASKQEFDEAKAKLASARAAKAKADAQIQSIEAASRASSAKLDSANVTVSESRIVSPIDGVLARLNIEQGYYFSPQTVQSTSEQGALSTIPVFIIDPGSFEISLDLPEHVFGQIAVDSAALIQPRSYTNAQGGGASAGSSGYDPASGAPPADSSVEGRVYSVTPSIDPDKRTFQVKVRTSKPQGVLHDGQFSSVWIASAKSGAAPALPFDAFRYQDGKPFVFVYDPGTQTVARRDVMLGARGRESQAVVQGIGGSDWVVTEGRSGLSDGDRVRLLDPGQTTAGAR